MDQDLQQVQQYWNDDSALMDTLIGGLVSDQQSAEFEAGILANPEAFGLGAYDPNGPPQYLGGRLAMHLRQSKEIYVDSRLRNLAKNSRRLFCKQYAYCANRQNMEGVNLAATIVDALLSSAAQIPIPLTSIAVYLVKKGILDDLCGCKKV